MKTKKLLLSSFSKSGNNIAVECCNNNWNYSYNDLFSCAKNFSIWAKKRSKDSVFVYFGNKSKAYYTVASSAFLFQFNFCPIDISNPLDRVAHILDQFEKYFIITDTKEHYNFLSSKFNNVIIYQENALSHEIREKDFLIKEEENPHYFIATSGSTGIPKIVSVSHDNTHDFVKWAINYYQINQQTRWSQFSSIGFDLSIVDLLSVLSGGGTLIVIDEIEDKLRPFQTIERAKISHWHSVPSIISYILRDAKTPSNTCKSFSFCGEPLFTQDVNTLKQLFPSARIINTYGPTEATLFCSFHEFNAEIKSTESTVSIGQPIPNWNFILKDLGENKYSIIIVSQNSNNKYLNSSNEKFTELNISGTTYYGFDTGDIVYLNDDGKMYFSHRSDKMVKINGNRIDLGEVDTACRNIGLQNPISMLVNGEIFLFLEENEASQISIPDQLSKLLPKYAIPNEYKTLKLHPRNANGKIDIKKLKESLEVKI